MNSDQLQSLLRTLLKIAGTAIVAHGTLGINGAMWEQISGALIMLAPVAWDMFAHTQKATVQAAAAIPNTTVVTTKALADATPNQENIVSHEEVKVVTK